eukprot:scaffold175278_cov18-Tisochrysis_lutea.AAC.1
MAVRLLAVMLLSYEVSRVSNCSHCSEGGQALQVLASALVPQIQCRGDTLAILLVQSMCDAMAHCIAMPASRSDRMACAHAHPQDVSTPQLKQEPVRKLLHFVRLECASLARALV